MSHQVALSSSTNDLDKYFEHGVPKEFWPILDQECMWGKLAAKLRKCFLFLNPDEKYELDGEIPTDMSSLTKKGGLIATNDKIELLEIRYGYIKDFAANKNALWFILKHREDNKGPPISMQSTFLSSVRVYDKYGKPEEVLPGVPVHVVKAARNGSDTYVLLAMYAVRQAEWNEAYKIAVTRLGEGERLVVHLEDSLPEGHHRCGIWMANAVRVKSNC